MFINKIQVDAVLSLNSIEDYIIDKKFSAFPQVVSTERPDKFCSNVVEGRVGLIIDGIPISIIIPATFSEPHTTKVACFKIALSFSHFIVLVTY
ncbi:spore germination protein [Clostridium cochlearium]|uniref:spore germination protein n=1 Tax=Clostridium cochlearium TaxID=1494 RepID=UPI001FAE0908|nr:spore germination protein [Clostridium cochlearium]